MRRVWFGGDEVLTAGYDAQCAVLEIEFSKEGQIRQYQNVSEDIWYMFKQGSLPDLFFHSMIKGNYEEKKINF